MCGQLTIAYRFVRLENWVTGEISMKMRHGHLALLPPVNDEHKTHQIDEDAIFSHARIRYILLLLTLSFLLAACHALQPITANPNLTSTLSTLPTPDGLSPDTTSIDAPDLSGMAIERTEYFSPNQLWHAEIVVALPAEGDESYYTALSLADVQNGLTWTPVAEWRNYGLGYTTPRIVYWSTDGRYLYFTNAPHPDGCALFTNASDLQQVDLTDGTVREVLPAESMSVVAVAPDGTIAMVRQKTIALTTLDNVGNLDKVGNDETVEIHLDFEDGNLQLGNLVWSPDSRQLAFTVAFAPCQPPAWRHAIYLLERTSESVQQVMSPDEGRMQLVEWVDETQLLLADIDGQQWLLDLQDGQLRMP